MAFGENLSGERPFYSDRLELADYHYVRDGLYALQVGHLTYFTPVTLTGMSEQRSSQLANYAFTLGLSTVVELREGRLDENGQPIILCTDEVSDSQVLLGASTTDRATALAKVIVKEGSQTFWVEASMPDRVQDYGVASVVMASALLEVGIDEARGFVRGVLCSNHILDTLAAFDSDRAQALLDYLKVCKRLQIEEETRYILEHGPRDEEPFGSEPIIIEETCYSFVGLGPNQGHLTDAEMTMIEPLFTAIKRGRPAMIEAARRFAYGLGVEPGSLDKLNPPSWWTNRENLQGLTSDEILLYHPSRITPEQAARVPNFLREIVDLSEQMTHIRRAWLMVGVSRDGFNQITSISKLTS